MQLVPIKASPSCPTWLIAHVLFSDANSQCSPCSPVRRRDKSGLHKNLLSCRNEADTDTFTKSANTNTGLKIKQSPWQQRQDGQSTHSFPKLTRTLPQTHHPTHTNDGCFTTASAHSCLRVAQWLGCLQRRSERKHLHAIYHFAIWTCEAVAVVVMSSPQRRNSHMHKDVQRFLLKTSSRTNPSGCFTWSQTIRNPALCTTLLCFPFKLRLISK